VASYSYYCFLNFYEWLAARKRGASVMDESQQQKINEAAQQFTEALTQSYEKVSDHAVSVQALNAELTQSFFDAVVRNLYVQAQSNREMTQDLLEQVRRGQEVGQDLAHESVNAHMEFIDSMFFYYQQSMEEAERSAERSA
jgi:phospholipid N-methyltransferase